MKGLDYIIAIGFVIIILMAIPGIPEKVGGWVGSTTPGPTTPGGADVKSVCPSGYAVEDVTYSYVIDDKYSAGTTVTSSSESVAIYVDGKKKDGAYTHSGDSLSLSPGQKVELFLYLSTESNSNTDANTLKHTFTVPCQGTYDDNIDALDLVTGGADGTATVTVNILDDTFKDVSGNGANTWAMSAGSSKAGTFKITGVNEDGFGATPSSTVCATFVANKTEVKDLVWTAPGVTKAQCRPQGAAVSYTDEEVFSYTFDRLEGVEVIDGSIAITMESTAMATDPVNYVNITFYDQQYFLNTDTGMVELGYEDEDHNLLGVADITNDIMLA